MLTFYKMHFPPFFHPLSIIFIPLCDIWAYFCPPRAGGGLKQKNIHPFTQSCALWILLRRTFGAHIKHEFLHFNGGLFFEYF